MEALGCLSPTLEPKATDHVPDMVATIEQIIANEHGYAVDGDVFFDVASLPGYGRLSGRAQVSCFLHSATWNMLYNVMLYCTTLCMQVYQYVCKYITLEVYYVICPLAGLNSTQSALSTLVKLVVECLGTCALGTATHISCCSIYA